jgi:cytohesin
LHLVAAIESQSELVPWIWPSCPLFVPAYRYKQEGVDRRIIYTLTESYEPPISLQEAAAIGDIDLTRSLLNKGIGVDSWDDSLKKTALQCAAMRGHREVVELLLAKGTQIEAQEDFPGGTALDYAAENGHRDVVELLMARGADINATRRGHPAGNTPLHSAVRAGYREIIDLLIAKKADVNAKNETGQTPLELAVRQNNKDIIELLIANDADINAKNNNGQTPLDIAVNQNRSDLAKLLVAKGADISFHAAARIGDLVIVENIIQDGTDLNAKDASGKTPLHYAVQYDHKDIVELLISKGANVNIKDDDGNTPGHVALGENKRSILELLIAKGANIVSIHLSAYQGDLDKVRDYLEKGTDANTVDAFGATPLHYAARQGHLELVKLLIAKGADVNAKNKNNFTPLHWAAGGGHMDVVALLIEKGANINSTEQRNYTPMHYAAWSGSTEVVELLVEKGADVNAKDVWGWTPLHYMAEYEYYRDMAEFLITKGADVNVEDKWGETPLHVAQDKGHTEIVELLQKYMLPHDVAITNVSVPSTCVQGDTIPVTITIVNKGGQKEGFCVTLLDVVTSVVIADQEVTLEPQRYKSANSSDLILSPTSSGKGNFGWGFNIHGDVNRDGCDDLLVGAGWWNGNRGRAYLYFGGADMDGIPDQIYTGETAGDFLGDGGAALGDVNGDGYDDVIIGARGYNNNDGRLYIFFGGIDMDKEPDVILDGEPGKTGAFSCNCLSVGDIDKDGYADVLVGACGYDRKRGRVYLYYGGEPMDSSADVVFDGERTDDFYGRNATIGQNVDGDGYKDILIGARTAPDGTRNGRVYLFYGGNRNQIDAVCDMTFTPPIGRPREFGSSLDIYDIDSDGYADVVIGARLGQGAVFIYWGDRRNKMDAVPDVVILGEDGAQSSLGGDKLFCADFNRDGYGDIAVGAYNWPRQKRIGRTYVYYGSTKTSIDTQPDIIFTGETESDWFGHDIGGGDFNNDGYTDLVAGAWGYNKEEGRAYVFYAPFEDKTNITFNWDTKNNSIGKHTLKIEIPPVPGEKNTEDNTKTLTIEIKERSN